MTKSEKLNPPTLRLYENENANKIPILFMTVGIVGSGKSYIAENLGVRRNGTVYEPVIHSSDALREELYGDINEQSNNADLFAELHKRIKADLQDGKDVIYDATNINKKRRTGFLQELKNIDCFKVCLCVMTPYEVCIEQNANRSRKVPNDVIKRMYMNWNPPALEEGFDDIVVAYNYGSISSEYYTLDNFFGGEVNADEISQENHHHKLTIGQHCRAAGVYAAEHNAENQRLVFAALTHDIGKVFTKTHINAKGFDDGECHFYQHQCVGAYLVLFYCNVMGVSQDDALYISNLIFYHMQPFLSWRNSKKAEEKQRRQMGETMYRDVIELHAADLAAH
jgi:predicted kinase